MIVNEIAKFENPLHARGQLLLVAQLGEPLLVSAAAWSCSSVGPSLREKV